ncbi:MAG: hypothetical protein H7333_12505 [Bdellovibrionales bacterium]|nr:hypothetical protein [Oligoflexia bacterium]
MRFSRTLTNQLGFTLTDTMMIAGLILFMISAFASYRFQQEKAAKAQETRNIYAQLRNNLKSGASQSQALSKTEELGYTEIK